MRVLVVEDEPAMADTVAEWLRNDSHAVDVVYNGDAALYNLHVNDYDVVVLDRDLPVIHGDQVCREIVSTKDAPRVLMLTASAEVGDRVEGLALGADDYLTKPFALPELSARVHALARRSRPASPPVLRRGDLVLDPMRREVYRAGRYVPLANREFAVLRELMVANGAIVTAEQLLEKAWDENIDPFSSVVRLTIHKLRRKLGAPDLIATISGAGYQIR